MAGYYDYVLGLIPLALFGVTTLLYALGIPLTAATPVGAGSAMLLVGHAMFVRAPVDVGVDSGTGATQSFAVADD
jgi:hypothetical protein